MTEDQNPPGSTEPPPPAGGAPEPTPPVGGEPPKSGMSGCAKAAIIGGVVVLVVIVGLVAAAIFGLSRFVGDVEEALEDSPCEFITSDEASEALGAEVQAVSGESALAAILGLIRDTRLLADAPFCFISDEEASIQVWVSVHEGSDAAEVFAAEADVADGQVVSETSTDSGSVTVETDPFRGEDVPGLGDEAFCVEAGPTVSGGVFARSDNRVVFVSALALAENQGADVLGDALCQRAVPIAESLLG